MLKLEYKIFVRNPSEFLYNTHFGKFCNVQYSDYGYNQNVYVLKMTFNNKCHFLKNDNLGTTGFIINARHVW